MFRPHTFSEELPWFLELLPQAPAVPKCSAGKV
jgi:hypothetical protein